MFDLTSSKLLILGLVALVVVGPKELPFLLRTVGKYMAMIRRHANEFRAQFDEAMREAELDSIRKDLESVAKDTENTIRSAQSDVERHVSAATQEIDHSLQKPASADEPAPAAEPVHVEAAADMTDAASAEQGESASTTILPNVTEIPAHHVPPLPSELAKTGT